ncbi:similar to thyroid hormone receptor interactor 12 [Plenodomus lingam JN3]|uniref:HECT-type E3 ubiquitin transferase n=1 Tax=Leptosphaeria maculans (strain JN3 / isolate v23.1.3 / race Av1-4-5-6-7-8) TaxID=985895 RepID=E4ZYB4_LEPMJ|nr:similar to thyroid hormone receptor interactor 12 [Plenodomus lingam JN3]CBX96359.1 similar to thyroid hormone receptor interactor 12 [Plenodomus lingam JN3]
MSSRVTRSSARRSTGAAANNENPLAQPPPPPSAPPTSSRKRKAAARDSSPEQPENTEPRSARASRAKRPKAEPQDAPAPAIGRSKKAKGKAAMSSAGPPSDPVDEKAAPSSSKRSKGGRKSGGQSDSSRRQPKSPLPENDTNPFLSSTSRRSSRKSNKAADEDTGMADAFGDKPEGEARQSSDDQTSEEEDEDGHGGQYDEEDEEEGEEEEEEEEEDVFTNGFLGRNPVGLSALRQLTGMMNSGTTQRLRGILEQLRSDDESIQMIALQELSEVLLISTEDNLAGHFSPDAYVKELVKLMQPPAPSDDPFTITPEPNPETMLLACRCLANLMEALPQATANVVYGNAVPVLCANLLNIQFIDLAEQCLSTLEKISVEFPSVIVREGGLSACLNYLDFFATSTQRTAVTTAANCCRNIPDDSFSVVRDAMGTLEGILNNNDQKVLEQGCICVSRIVQSFKHQGDKLEQLVSPGLLQAILRLLLPGSTNLIGSNIHTMFLQVLAYTAKASPRLSAELLKMNVVDTLYQILTGVSPPSGTDDVAGKIDSVVIMQALIHRPKDQVFETLNVICELLPDVPQEGLMYLDDLVDAGNPGDDSSPLSAQSKPSANQRRLEMLEGCKPEVKRFALILFPTLTDAYSSTVNLSVRQKVLTAHLKMLSNLDTDILEEALRPVPYASHLASIFTQQDHPTLVTYALQAAELLLKRLDSIYRYQFYREGVISEISQLANRPCKTLDARPKDSKAALEVEASTDSGSSTTSSANAELEHDMAVPEDVNMHSDDEDGEDDHEDDLHEAHEEHEEDDDSDSSSSSDHQLPAQVPHVEDIITLRAKKFIETHEKTSDKLVRDKASAVLQDLKTLASDIRSCVLDGGAGNCRELFTRLASYFEGDALESITSYELKSSKIVDVLLEIFTTTSAKGIDPRSVFLETFMGCSSKTSTTSATPSTPLGVLVHTLQDLLSRSEHFDVITVHQHAYDSRGSATSMLAKQLRLRLEADDDSGIPKAYRQIMVSIHAIATFKALDDYLRPRISIAEQRPRGNKVRESFAHYAQAMAEGRAPPPPHTPSESRTSKKASSKSKTPPTDPPQPGPSSATREKTRRSSRRQQAQLPPPPPPPAVPRSNSSHDPVECADEERLSDQDSMDEESALNAIVDDLEDDLDDDLPDPSAVSVEVASTGQATAREEDGTRVATPVHNALSAKTPSETRTPTSRLSALLQNSAMRQSLGSAASALSYAAAVQSIPQDWHIEFSVNDQPLSNETTIYRAVHFSQAQGGEVSNRTVWGATHTIKFKRVPGPPPAESSSLTPPPDAKADTLGMPASLNQHPVTSGILRLLSILHSLNANFDDILLDKKDQMKLNAEPLSQFVNTKLTAKLNRQLEEPLIVASNCLPSWSEDLARFYPFLFPFETRHLFLQSTSFGYSRSMTRWQNAQPTSDSRHDRHRDERPFLGRLQRQKVRISRARILESAMKVMQLYGHSASVLEVEYFEEVGTGLGPTLEFYSTVSKEFSKKKLKLWRENESSSTDEYAFGKRGLYPAPMSAEEANGENGEKRLELFKVLGKFVARSMLDSRIIDVSFNPTFFRIGDGSNTAVLPSLGAIKTVDNDLANSLVLLKQFADAKNSVMEDNTMSAAQKDKALQSIVIQDCRVEDLALDFTLPGYSSIELIPNGSDTAVTIHNVDMYVDKVIDFTLGSGVQRQADAFRAGFTEVFPYSALKAFTPDELVMLFGRTDEDWSLETLMDSIKADHGYNLDSKSVRNLLQTMSEFDAQERRDFLQFITGSPKLPIGGFKALTPMFTVVCKPSEPPYTSDDYLPSVMTCVNYLKMPDYSTVEILRQKLSVAIREGQGAFHLS